jgi:mono/diheme cytochrome c family protein
MVRSILIAGLTLTGVVLSHAQEIRPLGGASTAPIKLASIDRGLTLARRLCGDCHAIERGRTTSPNAEAPPFQAVADTRGMSVGALKVFFQTPHRMMPNLMLERADADDIIDYILSLKSPS